jgi:hypothetical protein
MPDDILEEELEPVDEEPDEILDDDEDIPVEDPFDDENLE